MYVIQINMENGDVRYVSWKLPQPSLVRSKQQASKFFRYNEAHALNDYFWNEYWNPETMRTRETVFKVSRSGIGSKSRKK